MARQIAGDSENASILKHARTAAQAELDLVRVRRVKVAVINIVHARGALGPAYDIGSVIKAYLYVFALSLIGHEARETMTRRVYSERYGKPIDQISAGQVFAGILQRLAQ